MITWLLQSGISMAVLLALYYLLLQREKMHLFNRFFLLFAICFSLVIPFIQFEVPAEDIPLAPVKQMVELVEQPPVLVDAFDQTEPRINLLPVFTILIYLVGALLMLTRFVINLWRLRTSIVKNKILPFGRARLVLIDQPILPHSFLNYIFVSKKDYDNKTIEEELFQHESTHVRQRHSWDIIFIECLLIICWFNPLLYLYKKAIKLNHEFLADESVLKINGNVPSYQQILLQKIFMNKASGLASHVHYSLTKKRLIMMTKNTPLFRGFLLKTLALSFCAGLILTFCIKAVARQSQKPQPQKQSPPSARNADTSKTPPRVTLTMPWRNIKNQDSLKAVKERYYSRHPERVYSFMKKGSVPVEKKWNEMNEEEKEMMFPPPPVPKRMKITQEQLDAWSDPKQYGMWLDGYRYKNELLANRKPGEFAHYSLSRITRTAKDYGKYKYHLMLMTEEYFNKWRKGILDDLGVDEKQ